MEDVCIFYGHWVYMYLLRPFGTFCGYLVYCMVIWYSFSRFGLFYQENLATLITAPEYLSMCQPK
jgi:hypothetical protein